MPDITDESPIEDVRTALEAVLTWSDARSDMQLGGLLRRCLIRLSPEFLASRRRH